VVALVASAAVSLFWLSPRLDVPVQLWASAIRVVSVDGRQLRVAEVEYSSGLRHVPSLGGLDGALFAFDTVLTTDKGMGMAGTLIPLDVVFFDPEGRFIDRYTMPVCETQECPGYFPRRPWQYAIEAPAGTLDWIDEGSQLQL
jgi:uncharacterized membrane protein (UPF0127 family)